VYQYQLFGQDSDFLGRFWAKPLLMFPPISESGESNILTRKSDRQAIEQGKYGEMVLTGMRHVAEAHPVAC
jgi:hypothetical protein